MLLIVFLLKGYFLGNQLDRTNATTSGTSLTSTNAGFELAHENKLPYTSVYFIIKI